MRGAQFKGNIIVTNMPEDFTGASLASLFDEFGLVLGAVIERPHGDEARALRGMVSLAPPSAVEAAIEKLDGQVLGSRHLKVRKAPETPKRTGPKRAPQPRRAAVARHASSGYAAPAPVVVRRAPIVERRTLGGPGYKRVRIFDESKNDRGN